MLNIPEDKLPQEFKDEARLDSLFSPVRSRTVNPRDWDTKIASWRHLISLYCINNGVYSFTLTLLGQKFLRNGRPPSCLGVVLEELVKTGDLQYLEDFVKESYGWGSWAADLLVKKPLSWSFNTVKRTLFTTQVNSNRTYVHVEVIRQEAQKIVSTSGKYRNKVINFAEFLKLANKDMSQVEDVKLLIHYLVREKKADVSNLKTTNSSDLDSFLIKLGDPNKLYPISEFDIALYVLEQNEKLFTKHVEDLEDEISACIKEVKAHLLKGHRQLAKTCLKKKHEIEKRLTHKANALHNIQVLIEKLKDVHTDSNVWQSYKHALSAFNTTLKETGLNEDAVEDTMLKLGEMLDIQEEIQAAISRPVSNENDDLEEELAELMKSEEESKSSTSADLEEQLSKLDINDLPEIPSTDMSLKEASVH
ncbi:charged multivesicular body protein 7 [Tribolium madens]|uniref:charged multivesicular body protein 7 n=1 Tax=Tribolium madens TaxID=41895 RepID=UPI001CF75320|nr:charged multivesicular body protein 7 [Tribolium madens]